MSNLYFIAFKFLKICESNNLLSKILHSIAWIKNIESNKLYLIWFINRICYQWAVIVGWKTLDNHFSMRKLPIKIHSYKNIIPLQIDTTHLGSQSSYNRINQRILLYRGNDIPRGKATLTKYFLSTCVYSFFRIPNKSWFAEFGYFEIWLVDFLLVVDGYHVTFWK